MNEIHCALGIFGCIPLAIILILAALGLTIIEDCTYDDCSLSHVDDENKLPKEMIDGLWILLFVAPLSLFGMLYFALFTKYDPSTFNTIKETFKGKDKN
jgi:hypothetical protein